MGGEDHKTGDLEYKPEDKFDKLIAWTKDRFPIEDIIYRWSGQVMEPKGSVAFIGHNPNDANNVYIATGDSGNGMTHGTIAGILLTDMIVAKENHWATLYDPSREIKENKNNNDNNADKSDRSSSKNNNSESADENTKVEEELNKSPEEISK